jgi:hypothetical protein
MRLRGLLEGFAQSMLGLHLMVRFGVTISTMKKKTHKTYRIMLKSAIDSRRVSGMAQRMCGKTYSKRNTDSQFISLNNEYKERNDRNEDGCARPE